MDVQAIINLLTAKISAILSATDRRAALCRAVGEVFDALKGTTDLPGPDALYRLSLVTIAGWLYDGLVARIAAGEKPEAILAALNAPAPAVEA